MDPSEALRKDDRDQTYTFQASRQTSPAASSPMSTRYQHRKESTVDESGFPCENRLSKLSNLYQGCSDINTSITCTKSEFILSPNESYTFFSTGTSFLISNDMGVEHREKKAVGRRRLDATSALPGIAMHSLPSFLRLQTCSVAGMEYGFSTNSAEEWYESGAFSANRKPFCHVGRTG